MPARDLRDRYGGRTNEALNRAVRAEIDGGAELLDALHLAHRIARRYRPGDPQQALAQTAIDCYTALADRARSEIERRYQIAAGGDS